MKICKAKIDDKWQTVTFHGVFQYSDVIAPSPMVGGHPGGIIAYPIAVVEYESGKLIMRYLDSIKEIREVEYERT